jgi:hypothetical protein
MDPYRTTTTTKQQQQHHQQQQQQQFWLPTKMEFPMIVTQHAKK